MAITSFERTYATARSALSTLEVISWIVVITGLIGAIIGFATGGLIGQFFGDPPIMARLISAVPGVLVSVGGLFSIAYVQVSRATVDTAEMTRELLGLARGGNVAPTTTMAVASQESHDHVLELGGRGQDDTDRDLSKARHVQMIGERKAYIFDDGVILVQTLVGMKQFANLEEAKRYLS